MTHERTRGHHARTPYNTRVWCIMLRACAHSPVLLTPRVRTAKGSGRLPSLRMRACSQHTSHGEGGRGGIVHADLRARVLGATLITSAAVVVGRIEQDQLQGEAHARER